MSDVNLREVALRFAAAGVATTLVLTGVAVAADFPLQLLGMILTGVPLFVVPGIVGVTDAGIETATASARIGAPTGNPEQYQTGNVIPIPNPLQAVCWLCGVGVAGVVLLALTA
ncbi:hypothetical protein [Halobacterium wangiae]|uniref:hypothetical protein n=1 Tax=Halobacterium wangiae TaxID=2902623 RepID=UPI001E42D318|nr:hypothetical protein [Halobacterium wangiae]